MCAIYYLNYYDLLIPEIQSTQLTFFLLYLHHSDHLLPLRLAMSVSVSVSAESEHGRGLSRAVLAEGTQRVAAAVQHQHKVAHTRLREMLRRQLLGQEVRAVAERTCPSRDNDAVTMCNKTLVYIWIT